MRRWTSAEGLPHDSVSALLQTRDGYLWIGTANAGLVRFDGVAFKTFNLLNTPGLASDRIGALYQGADGTLWIGTSAGLVRYDDGVFTSERLGEDASHNIVVAICADQEGRLWVASPGQIVRRDDGKWTVISIGGSATGLWPSRDGTMWIGTSEGLIEWRGRAVRTLTTRDGLPSNFVAAVHENHRGRLWVGTDRGLAQLDRRDERIIVKAILPQVSIDGLFEDSRGVLWIGSEGRLFRRAADEALSEASLLSGGSAEVLRVAAFIEDREGHVWFGADGGRGGLYRLARERVSTLAHEDGLPCDNIGAVTQSVDGTIWVAALCTGGRGLIAIRDGALTEHSEIRYVESLLAEPDGTLWVGTFEGRLFRYVGDHFDEIPSPVREGRAVEDGIAVVYRHDDGALWLGTSRGLLKLHDGMWTRLRATDGLVSEDVRSIAGGGDGSMWIGTDAGVSRYRDGRFTSYRTADGVPPGPVRAIYADADGVIWIGTYGGGLARFKDGVFTSFGVLDGVLDSSVHRILEDAEGFLWVTGDRGIRRVSKRDLHAIASGRALSPEVIFISEADGMRSMECNGMAQPAGWRMRDGTFQFPTQRGLVRIDPARDLPPALPPPAAHIEDAIVDGQPSASGPEVVAPAGSREVEIRYTAPAFARPEQVQFRYRLEGHDRDWMAAGTRRIARYASLPPGRFRFVVSARNGGGPWSEHTASVALVLQPYVYQRVPFQIALILIIAAGSAALGRWYIRGLRGRAEQLERAVAERTADLSIARDSLANSHKSLAHAKQEVEEAHGQVLAVLNQLDIGVLVLDARGMVAYASASAQRILGKDQSALVGQPWSACLPLLETDRGHLQARVDGRSSAGTRLPLQMVLGGKRYWMEIDVRDEPRPGTGRILYMYNVTEVSTLPASGESDAVHGLIGRSTAMHVVQKQIRDVARVDATVLIEGETGAGKELVARAIHRGSRRAERPFVAINAAGLSESLLASQLFGHRRGAFTGAFADQMGVFEAANGGTLFLDEIGDMPLDMQASLLRVLQEREITRIGDSHARPVDVRFLAATHRDLTKEVLGGRFREDLLYRIRIATIAIPPLRNRMDDVPVLVEAFLTQAAKQAGRAVPEIGRDAVQALMRHTWPGNVRELKGVVEQSLLRATGDVIRLEDLPPEIIGGREVTVTTTPMIATAAGSEREQLVDALRRARGNRAEAARLLGVSRSTLYRRLADHGLEQ